MKTTPIDYLAGHICLYFELVYSISRQSVREQGYLEQLLQFESDEPDTRKWFAHMRDEIWE